MHHLTTCEANSINMQRLASLRALSRLLPFVLDADEFLKLFVPKMHSHADKCHRALVSSEL